jgi:carboxymethylenebutenolidase
VAIETSWVSLRDGGPEGYLAVPAATTLPPAGAVVVGMEVFGVTKHVRDLCDRFAREGYVALAPDFYWREVRRSELDYHAEGRTEGMRLTSTLRRETVLSDVADARAHAMKQARLGTGTAIVGFSLGGHIAMLSATRIPFDFVASFYGGWTLDGGIPLASPMPPATDCSAIAQNETFVFGVVGGRDHLISADEWRRLEERLEAAHVAHELVLYPEAPHGFLCEDRAQTFRAADSDDAWKHLLDLLKRHVSGRRARRA